MTPIPAKPLSLPAQLLVNKLAEVNSGAKNNRNLQKNHEGEAEYYKIEADRYERQAAELTKALKKLGHKA